jgi:hypothetical protein
MLPDAVIAALPVWLCVPVFVLLTVWLGVDEKEEVLV